MSIIKTPEDLERALIHMLEADERPSDADLGVRSARSFADIGYLTNERGFVLRLANGAKYEITIKPAL